MVRFSGNFYFNVELDVDLAREDGRNSCKGESQYSKEENRERERDDGLGQGKAVEVEKSG